MASRRAIPRLASCAAVVATLVSLAASPPAAANTDRYGNTLTFLVGAGPVACNPDYANLVVRTGGGPIPWFRNAVAWVDYFGIPVASVRFQVPNGPGSPFRPADTVVRIPFPSASAVPAGVYTLNVLLQGNAELYGGLLGFVFTTVSDTATIDPALNPDCTPIAAAASASASSAKTTIDKPSRRVLARRVRAMRRDADTWFEGPLGARAKYPKARFCGETICVQRRAGATWEPVARH